MTMEIKKVAVIGAGVMGAQIAAQIANAGTPVVLLDIVPPNLEEGGDRTAIAKGALEKLMKMEPAPFMHKKNAKLVTPGNLEDDLEMLRDCDWIIEAIIERLDLKQNLYKKIDLVRKPGSVVSSNTSTIPLAQLTGGMSDEFDRDFMVTHFFNPPRYLRLLELVPGAKTERGKLEAIRDFCDVRLGKGVVVAKDTPGFIGNRIGIYWIQSGINAAFDLGLTVEEADAALGKPMGAPKTGIFGLVDLVGLDLMPHINKSMLDLLPAKDAYRDAVRDLPLVQKMIGEGYTGRKGKGGFYRLNRDGDKKIKETIDLALGTYRPEQKARLVSIQSKGLKNILAIKDKGSEILHRVLLETLSYSASLLGEIADTIPEIDQALRLGFNWKFGPFELIDQLGAGWLADELKKAGKPVPKILESGQDMYRVEGGVLEFLTLDGSYKKLQRPDGVLLLQDVKRAGKPVLKGPTASVWDIGDGVLCFELTGKMNTIDPTVFQTLGQTIAMLSAETSIWRALVLYSEQDYFSAGANLGLALFALNVGLYEQIDELVAQGQAVYKAMKYAPFPVVGAPGGLALGGGCEILLHTDAVQAHAELYMGLVECGVGLVPGWGGCKEMLGRAYANKKRPGGPMPPISQMFEQISMAKFSKSAAEAKDLMYLRDSDGITMNRDRLLADAKRKVLELADGYKPPEEFTPLPLPGQSAISALGMAVDGFRAVGLATPHDVTVSLSLADVLSGGAEADMLKPTTEDEILALEQKVFGALIRTPQTLARIENMLVTGKPLRN